MSIFQIYTYIHCIYRYVDYNVKDQVYSIAEYEMFDNVPTSSQALNEQDVPCVVCYVTTRVTALMIPGKHTSLQNWTREYYGWLMAERLWPSHKGRTTFE